MKEFELNFDGLVGPTHNYAGLAWGNVASDKNSGLSSSPRGAALEGLEKMRFLYRMGIFQGALPPIERPSLSHLRSLGFRGSDEELIVQVSKANSTLLAQSYSASAMWAANAATVAPSADTYDGKVHFLPANLVSTAHRFLETSGTARLLKRVFPGPCFVHHAPLPSMNAFADEGAANHMRLRATSSEAVHVFVYGRSGSKSLTRKFPARQTREASAAVARCFGVKEKHLQLVCQNSAAIDLGVFHNDVIAVSHENVLLYHERAYVDASPFLHRLRQIMQEEFVPVAVSEDELSVSQAVESYLFNSQIVSKRDGGMAFIAPRECQEMSAAKDVLDRVVADDNPIDELHFVDVRESMRNGGGPACLRLRVTLNEKEIAQVHQPCLLNEEKIDTLAEWVKRHYRDRLHPDDLRDPMLLAEVRTALDELTKLLDLGSDFYSFQGLP